MTVLFNAIHNHYQDLVINIKLGNEHLILYKSKYLPSSDIENVFSLF